MYENNGKTNNEIKIPHIVIITLIVIAVVISLCLMIYFGVKCAQSKDDDQSNKNNISSNLVTK